MNYKCKFCGYRFKDKDEQICPECLTAREEDISCGVYGEADHSHAVYDDIYGKNMFKNNDTFRDGRADFLKDERRSENRNEAARYERRNGGDIDMEADHRRQRYAQPYSAPTARPSGNMPANNRQNGCSKGCGIIIVIIIALIVFGNEFSITSDTVIEKLNEFIGNVETEDTSETESVTETADTKPVTTTAKSADNDDILPAYKNADVDVDILIEKETVTSVMTDDVTVPDNVRETLYFIDDDDNYELAVSAEPRLINKYELRLMVKHTDGTGVSEDEFKVNLMDCLAVDENGYDLSIYSGWVSDKLVYIDGDSSMIVPTVYADNTAETVYLFIDAEYNGQTVNFTLEL